MTIMKKNWKPFEAKYDTAIKSIAEAENCDMGEARLKLVYMAEHPGGEKYAGVPEGFDWAQCFWICRCLSSGGS